MHKCLNQAKTLAAVCGAILRCYIHFAVLGPSAHGVACAPPPCLWGGSHTADFRQVRLHFNHMEPHAAAELERAKTVR